MKLVTRVVLQAACLGSLLLSGAVFAQAGIAISPVAATVGVGGGATNPGTFQVNFTNTTPATISAYQTDIGFNNAQLTIVPTLGAGAAAATTCVIVGGNILRLTDFDAGGGSLPDGTACTFTVTAANPQTVGTTYTLNVNATLCSDAASMPVTCAETDSVITVTAGPSGPTLAYNPVATTPIVVPASISGTAITTSIAVTPSGGDTGESTTLACSVSGTGYVATVTGSPFPSGSTTPGSVGLGCAGTAGAQTLTCTATRSGSGGGTTVSTWPLTCAAAPGFASTPAPGGTLNIVGITGSTAVGAVNVSNPGTAALTLSGCAVTGTGLTLGTVTASIASGGTGSIGVSCAVPATAGSTLTGTLTCATNAAAPNNNVTYQVSCLAQSASIPTLGFGGKALMVLLMLGFGLVGFQLYRRSA